MPPEPLYLRLCPNCGAEPVQVGVCVQCGGAGVLDAHDRPFRPGPPFDRWTPKQLVALDADAQRRRGELADRRYSRLTEVARMTHTPGDGARVELEPRRRLTLSDVVELLLARGGSSEHSTVRLSRNAKGDTQIEVVVRTGDPGIDTVDAARAKAEEQYDHLRRLYPIAEGK